MIIGIKLMTCSHSDRLFLEMSISIRVLGSWSGRRMRRKKFTHWKFFEINRNLMWFIWIYGNVSIIPKCQLEFGAKTPFNNLLNEFDTRLNIKTAFQTDSDWDSGALMEKNYLNALTLDFLHYRPRNVIATYRFVYTLVYFSFICFK